jgi:hypothetical protein
VFKTEKDKREWLRGWAGYRVAASREMGSVGGNQDELMAILKARDQVKPRLKYLDQNCLFEIC